MEPKKLFFLFLVATLLTIGVVGIFVPILPTTPLVLAAFICFTKSSKRAETWIQQNRYFGSYIENYRTKRGVPYDVKLKSVGFLWVTMMVSMLIFQQRILLIILPLVGVAVTAHILTLKTSNDEITFPEELNQNSDL
jgi:uncharacterized membrane protein YbaN (DUF454 family)